MTGEEMVQVRRDDLRDAIADELPWPEYDLADRVLRVLREHRDELLTLVGMEQVGWHCAKSGGLFANNPTWEHC